MRLLNTETLRLESFQQQTLPRYAILSHTWGDEEVLFQDLNPGHDVHNALDAATSKRGFEKVRSSAKLAAQEGFSHIWIDTCCIDKSSSAELSEAINSMFLWYQLSQVCYVYMEDVHRHPTRDLLLTQFAESRWFTRGWTLQELIAPGKAVFHDAAWTPIGSRAELSSTIEKTTTIPAVILANDEPYDAHDQSLRHLLSNVSVAHRFSWAAGRPTTRVEDEAYALLGLFNLHMPTIYGEGKQAFQRLQEELLAICDDQSLLVYHHESDKRSVYGERPFAPSARAFVRDVEGMRDHAARRSMTLTNRGLELDVQLCYGRLTQTSRNPTLDETGQDEIAWVAALDCSYFDSYLSRPGLILDSVTTQAPHVKVLPDTFRRRWGKHSVLRFDPHTPNIADGDSQSGAVPQEAVGVYEEAGVVWKFQVLSQTRKRIFIQSPRSHPVKEQTHPVHISLSGPHRHRYRMAYSFPRAHRNLHSSHEWLFASPTGHQITGYAVFARVGYDDRLVHVPPEGCFFILAWGYDEAVQRESGGEAQHYSLIPRSRDGEDPAASMVCKVVWGEEVSDWLVRSMEDGVLGTRALSIFPDLLENRNSWSISPAVVAQFRDHAQILDSCLVGDTRVTASFKGMREFMGRVEHQLEINFSEA